MTRFRIPNSASIHTLRSFLNQVEIFVNGDEMAVLEFHPRWAHMEPVALAMVSAWGAWCRRLGKRVEVENLAHHGDYAARMRLFEHLSVNYKHGLEEHEEIGRFLPVTQVNDRRDIAPVIGNISALLHLEDDQESLAAVQYCVSELLRNVLEHSNSQEGAFVCAHRYMRRQPYRVSIAVADCGQGIAQHLGVAHPEALGSL